jgi:hypothetical protein
VPKAKEAIMAIWNRIGGNGNLDPGARLGLGLAAGLAGTKVIERSMQAGDKVAPEAAPPMRGDPAEFVLNKVEARLPERIREKVSEKEGAAKTTLHLAYGALAGAAYGLLRPGGGNPFRDGLLLGSGVWAVGYLGWLPRAGLLAPPTEQRPQQLLRPLAEHLIYGIATAAAFRGATSLVARLRG